MGDFLLTAKRNQVESIFSCPPVDRNLSSYLTPLRLSGFDCRFKLLHTAVTILSSIHLYIEQRAWDQSFLTLIAVETFVSRWADASIPSNVIYACCTILTIVTGTFINV